MFTSYPSIVLSLFFVLFSSHAQAVNWKGLFIAGDYSIENFDNGREDLTKILSERGALSSIQLSSSEKYISEQNQVYPAIFQNIQTAFHNMKPQDGEGCLIHMTSHGAQNQGFYLALSGILPPPTFSSLVNQTCGDKPTIIMVSACFSGQFITEDLKGPNRIILTAARSDRPSFGCSADTEYTYWDGCLISEMPNANTWVDLNERVKSCITKKESAINERPSEPQSYFGENTLDWTILN